MQKWEKFDPTFLIFGLLVLSVDTAAKGKIF